MKDRLIHLMLWQKRNELRIEDDVQQDWLEMQAQLDKHIPGGGGSGSAGASSFTTGLKLLSVLLVALAAAAIIYFGMMSGGTKNRPQQKMHIAVTNSNGNNAENTVNTSNSATALNRATANTGTVDKNGTEANAGRLTTGKNGNEAPGVTNKSSEVPATPPSANAPVGSRVSNAVASVNKNEVLGSSRKPGNSTIHNNKSTTNAPGAAAGMSANTAKNKAAKYHYTKPTAAANTEGNNLAKSPAKPNGLIKMGHHYGMRGTGSNSGVSHSSNASRLTVSADKGGRNAPGSLHSQRNRVLTGPGNKPGQFVLNGKVDANGANGLNMPGQPNPTTTKADSIAQSTEALQIMIPQFVDIARIADGVSAFMISRAKAELEAAMANKAPNSKGAKSTGAAKLDWGILVGANSSGSFTGKAENKNFYGSLPVDMYAGLFATYNFNDKWGLGLQLRGLNPQTVSGSYTHANQSKIDTNQTLVMTDGRKVYFIDVPLNLVYKPTTYLSFKAGPVFSLPVKQANGLSSFQTGKLKKDSVYYRSVTNTINATTYSSGIDIGLSGGASLQFGRFIFDASYQKSFSGLTVSSGLGSYNANNGLFLFSVGFRLNKRK